MNENYEVNEVVENEEVTEVVKPTLKERLSNIPVKKVLKIGGIVAGSIAGAIFLGKVVNPDYNSDGNGEVPFEPDYTEVPSEDAAS